MMKTELKLLALVVFFSHASFASQTNISWKTLPNPALNGIWANASTNIATPSAISPNNSKIAYFARLDDRSMRFFVGDLKGQWVKEVQQYSQFKCSFGPGYSPIFFTSDSRYLIYRTDDDQWVVVDTEAAQLTPIALSDATQIGDDPILSSRHAAFHDEEKGLLVFDLSKPMAAPKRFAGMDKESLASPDGEWILARKSGSLIHVSGPSPTIDVSIDPHKPAAFSADSRYLIFNGAQLSPPHSNGIFKLDLYSSSEPVLLMSAPPADDPDPFYGYKGWHIWENSVYLAVSDRLLSFPLSGGKAQVVRKLDKASILSQLLEKMRIGEKEYPLVESTYQTLLHPEYGLAAYDGALFWVGKNGDFKEVSSAGYGYVSYHSSGPTLFQNLWNGSTLRLLVFPDGTSSPLSISPEFKYAWSHLASDGKTVFTITKPYPYSSQDRCIGYVYFTAPGEEVTSQSSKFETDVCTMLNLVILPGSSSILRAVLVPLTDMAPPDHPSSMPWTRTILQVGDIHR